MKKIKVFIMVFALIFLVLLVSKGYQTYADGETEMLPENTEEVIEETLSEKVNEAKSKTEKWLENNLGWIVGIPTGTGFAAILEIIALAKKTKKKDEELEQTTDTNKKAKESIEIAKTMLGETLKLADSLRESSSYIVDHLGVTDELIIAMNNTFDGLNNTIKSLSNKIETLEKVQELIASQSKELVVNGVSAQVTKLIRENKEQ